MLWIFIYPYSQYGNSKDIHPINYDRPGKNKQKGGFNFREKRKHKRGKKDNNAYCITAFYNPREENIINKQFHGQFLLVRKDFRCISKAFYNCFTLYRYQVGKKIWVIFLGLKKFQISVIQNRKYEIASQKN